MSDVKYAKTNIEKFKEAICKLTYLLSGKGVRIIFRGFECSTTGKVMVLPSVDILQSSKASDEEINEFIEALIGAVDHEVAHLLFTDMTLYKKTAKKYGKLHFAILINAIEDCFVERKMVKYWPGSLISLDKIADFAMKRSTEKERKSLHVVTQIALIVSLLGRRDKQKIYAKAYDPDVLSWVNKNLKSEIASISKVKDTKGSIVLAKRIYAKIEKWLESSEKERKKEKREEQERNSKEDEMVIPNNDKLLQKAFKKLTDSIKTTYNNVGEPSLTAYTPYTTEGDYIGDMRRDDANDWQALYDLQKCISKKTSFFAMSINDAFNTKKAYQALFEKDLFIRYKKIEGLALATTGPLKSALERVLKVESTDYKISGLLNGKLDRKLLHRLPVYSKVNLAPRVCYEYSKHMSHNLAILICVNQSASMLAPVSDITNERDMIYTRMDMAAASALALGEVLHSLNISFGILGHTTKHPSIAYNNFSVCSNNIFARYGNIVIEWVKNFNDAWLVKRSLIGGLCYQHNTYDAEMVRYGIKALSTVDVDRRIMIMLDDGEPVPCLDALISYHRKELKNAVKEAAIEGVEVIGVGMESESVRQYYNNYVVVSNLAELPNVLLGKFGQLLNVRCKLERERGYGDGGIKAV